MGLCCDSDSKLEKKTDLVIASRKASQMTKEEYQDLARDLAKAVMKRFDGDKSRGLTQTEAT